jgi:hypothetical protein
MSDKGYHFAVYLNLLDWLAEQYHKGDVYERARIAGICDEMLDRSGRLLGTVRRHDIRTAETSGAPKKTDVL